MADILYNNVYFMKKTIRFILDKFISLNYGLSSHLVEPNEVDRDFRHVIEERLKVLGPTNVVIEAGGCNRPYFKLGELDSIFIGVDVDDHFNSSNYYNLYYAQSIELELPVRFDLLFSRYLMEHVRNNELSFSNQIKSCLKGGYIVHTYPLGMHPFSLINRLLGNKLARYFIRIFRRESIVNTGYKAYYSSGNSFALEKILKRHDVDYKIYYYYDALDYFRFFYPFALIIFLFNHVSKTLNLRIFASNVLIVITKSS